MNVYFLAENLVGDGSVYSSYHYTGIPAPFSAFTQTLLLDDFFVGDTSTGITTTPLAIVDSQFYYSWYYVLIDLGVSGIPLKTYVQQTRQNYTGTAGLFVPGSDAGIWGSNDLSAWTKLQAGWVSGAAGLPQTLSGMPSYRYYQFKTSSRWGGLGTVSFTITDFRVNQDTTPVGPPSGGGAPTPCANVLTWSAADSAVSYIVARSASPTGPFTAIATGIEALTYTDPLTIADNGVTYYYVLYSVDAIGNVSAASSPSFSVASVCNSASPIDNCHPAREATVCGLPSREATACSPAAFVDH